MAARCGIENVSRCEHVVCVFEACSTRPRFPFSSSGSLTVDLRPSYGGWRLEMRASWRWTLEL